MIPSEPPPLSEQNTDDPPQLPPTFTIHRCPEEEGKEVVFKENLSGGELGIATTEEDSNISSCEKIKSDQIKGMQDDENIHETVNSSGSAQIGSR